METNENKKSEVQTKTRNLKVYQKIRVYDHPNSKVIPEIRFCGEWLEKLGFTPQTRISIQTMNKQLIIQVME